MSDITVAIDALDSSAGHGGDEEPLVEEELLVEEISIDGMCGVY
jgi:mycofactocin precursor